MPGMWYRGRTRYEPGGVGPLAPLLVQSDLTNCPARMGENLSMASKSAVFKEGFRIPGWLVSPPSPGGARPQIMSEICRVPLLRHSLSSPWVARGYPSDLTGEQGVLVELLLPPARVGPTGKRWETHPRRRVADAIFYVVWT